MIIRPENAFHTSLPMLPKFATERHNFPRSIITTEMKQKREVIHVDAQHLGLVKQGLL